VGTGFHPELTGRENIYLNGAILGMKRAEITRKFDEIVEFAEIERFLDTPVKRYSSGMYTRLAFSIAAYLEPEILIVDEVLAVGDISFQQKCLGKMGDVVKEGRTVLFVSHNIGVIQTLCTRVILLRNGIIVADDTAAAAVATYLSGLEEVSQQALSERRERGGKGEIRITGVEISTGTGASHAVLATGRPARFVFHMSAIRAGMSCSFTIYDHSGQPVTFFDSAIHSQEDVAVSEHDMTFLCETNELPLIPGRYRINAAVMYNGELQDHLEGVVFVEVEQGHLRGRPVPSDTGYGSVLIPHRWTIPK
jgi:lipopolysaccharide transport system ATP-binding protein